MTKIMYSRFNTSFSICRLQKLFSIQRTQFNSRQNYHGQFMVDPCTRSMLYLEKSNNSYLSIILCCKKIEKIAVKNCMWRKKVL